jgi:aspartate kinase
MSTLVMKFGGSALGSISALTQVFSIVMYETKRWNRLLLVASALDGVTDMLLEAAHLAQIANQRGYRRIAANLRTRHMALSEQLSLGTQERNTLQADINQLIFEMLDECQTLAATPSETLSPAVSDRIIGVGEKLSARIIAALLRDNDLRGVAIDGTNVIVTDDIHGNATPLLDLSCQQINSHLLSMLDHQIIPVVTGFIGATVDGKATTIGRGGSDYTASIIATCTNAEEVWIWSDVDGMMSADPKESPDAQLIDEMSYDEIAELAYFGAQILHAKMVHPLQESSIALRIKNIYKPQQSGTLIHNAKVRKGGRIVAVTSISGIGLTANRSGSLSNIIGIVDDTLFDKTGSHADVMISSQSSARSFLCFIVPTHVGGVDAVDLVRDALDANLSTLHDSVHWTVEPVMIVTTVGENLTRQSALIAQILQQLEDIHPIALAQGPSQCSLSLIVHPDEAEIVLNRIHEFLLQ